MYNNYHHQAPENVINSFLLFVCLPVRPTWPVIRELFPHNDKLILIPATFIS